LRFFTEQEAAAIGVLAERVFPATADGPGARAAHVVEYLDAQLAGPWGAGARLYRQEPFLRPEHPGHGWQLPMTPAEAYRHSIAALNAYAVARWHGRTLDRLTDAEADELMLALDRGHIDTFGEPPAAEFFSMMLKNVAEGLFGDPSYGGNFHLIGWRWIGFPGDPDAYGEPYATHMGSSLRYSAEPQPLPSPE
jgi:gluconate 2-dehydrogenase gamma chain